MTEIKKENSNDCISGGYIFDQVDKFSHDYIKDKYTIKGYLFTSCAHISYRKQICNWEDCKIIMGSNYVFDDAYMCLVRVIDKNTKDIYATARLTFVEKKKTHCGAKKCQSQQS